MLSFNHTTVALVAFAAATLPGAVQMENGFQAMKAG